MIAVTVLLLCFVISGVHLTGEGEVGSYRNYKIYEVTPATVAEVQLLHEHSDHFELDFWGTPKLRRRSPVLVSPKFDDQFADFLAVNNITYQLINENVQQSIDRENDEQQKHRRTKREVDKHGHPVFRFDHFWQLEEIYNYLGHLERTYPDLVRVQSFGKTHEGRPLKVIFISSQGEVNSQRPVVLIDGGIHAREWGSHMAVLHLIQQLVEHSVQNAALLNNTDWVIMPVANPDGYVYSHSSAENRLWRKNRVPVSKKCFGVDLNRNFPFRWKPTGTPCTLVYSGATPSSEAETRAITLLMALYANVTKVYLAVHTCGDYILYPYGYDLVEAENNAELQKLGKMAAAAVEAIGGPSYEVGSAAEVLYPANGSDDYAYASVGVDFAYTLELSCATAKFTEAAFMLNVTQMNTVNKHAFEMFKVFGKFAGEQTVAWNDRVEVENVTHPQDCHCSEAASGAVKWISEAIVRSLFFQLYFFSLNLFWKQF